MNVDDIKRNNVKNTILDKASERLINKKELFCINAEPLMCNRFYVEFPEELRFLFKKAHSFRGGMN